ncbi:hypothetical protein ACFLIN_05885 [Corynebacterium kutscheri]|nr:hypothetical protein [Corynebacterium kutscheri]
MKRNREELAYWDSIVATEVVDLMAEARKLSKYLPLGAAEIRKNIKAIQFLRLVPEFFLYLKESGAFDIGRIAALAQGHEHLSEKEIIGKDTQLCKRFRPETQGQKLPCAGYLLRTIRQDTGAPVQSLKKDADRSSNRSVDRNEPGVYTERLANGLMSIVGVFDKDDALLLMNCIQRCAEILGITRAEALVGLITFSFQELVRSKDTKGFVQSSNTKRQRDLDRRNRRRARRRNH